MAREVGTVNGVYFPSCLQTHLCIKRIWFLSLKYLGSRKFISALAVYVHSCVRYGRVVCIYNNIIDRICSKDTML